MHYKPSILLIIFNRPDKTKSIIKALSEFKPPVIYVSADGPRDFNENGETSESKTPEPKTESNNTDLQRKIDLLLKRLDDLEKESKRSPSENQTEIIAFVATGAFLIFTLSLLR